MPFYDTASELNYAFFEHSIFSIFFCMSVSTKSPVRNFESVDPFLKIRLVTPIPALAPSETGPTGETASISLHVVKQFWSISIHNGHLMRILSMDFTQEFISAKTLQSSTKKLLKQKFTQTLLIERNSLSKIVIFILTLSKGFGLFQAITGTKVRLNLTIKNISAQQQQIWALHARLISQNGKVPRFVLKVHTTVYVFISELASG